MNSPSSVSESDNRHQIYSRKQKSLGLLCTNFIGLYDREDADSISLDDAARKLGVERRRIYDIVNVMESVGALSRKGKNQYSWIGFSGIPAALENLKKENIQGLSCNSNDKTEQNSDDDEEGKQLDQNGSIRDSKATCCFHTDQKREKSLGLLAQNFVKLFLTSQMETIALDEAAKLLLGDCRDAAQMKTKVRRLYDIANVLSSMSLIEKTSQADTRKPAFRWLGTSGKHCSGVTVAIPPPPPTAKSSGKREFGSEITNTSCKRGKLSSRQDPQKPGRAFLKHDDVKECNLASQKQLQSSKDYVFGPFQPVKKAKLSSSEAIKGCKGVQEQENLASTCHLQYCNKALGDLFSHYLEAWNSWFGELAGSKIGRKPPAASARQFR